MLYRQKQKTHLPPSLFQNPSPEYRAFPFWAWNGELEPEVLLRQIKGERGGPFGWALR